MSTCSSWDQLLSQIKINPHQWGMSTSVEQLEQVIQHSNQNYYIEGGGWLSDELYDMLHSILQERSPTSVALQQHTSTNVGDKVKVTLPYWMGSMDKIKPAINEKDTTLQRWKQKYTGEYHLSTKLDGISGLLVIKKVSGTIATPSWQFFTRGNGIEGTDITPLLPFLPLQSTIAQLLSSSGENVLLRAELERQKLSTLSLRGELIMKKNVFDTQWSHKKANPRNLVAGAINAKVVDPNALAAIDFVVYEVIEPLGLSPAAQLDVAQNLGFTTVDQLLITGVPEDSLTYDKLSNTLIHFRDTCIYEVDGLVVSDNKPHQRNTSGNPKYAFAFKMVMSDQLAETTVEKVTWNPSKDGYLKPRIHVTPVQLVGVTIRHVTGFNGRFIETNQIGPGTVVRLVRSGDVIPHIEAVVKPSQAQMPTADSYHWNESGIDLVINDFDDLLSDYSQYWSPEIRLKQIAYFFGKIGTKQVSQGIFQKLIQAGYHTIPQILALTPDDLVVLDGFQQKLAERTCHNLQTAFQQSTVLQLMSASNQLGRGLGEKKIVLVLNRFPNLLETDWNLASPTQQEQLIQQVCQIDGFSHKTATQIVTKLPKFQQFVVEIQSFLQKDQLKWHNNDVSSAELGAISLGGNPLFQKVVLTGTRDSRVIHQIEQDGGKISSSVNGQTTLLVCQSKTKTSGKLQAAEELQIPIWTVEEFLQST